MALSSGYYLSSTDTKLLNAFRSGLASGLGNQKVQELEEIKNVIQLYRDARNDPDVALSTITNEMVEKILEPSTESFKGNFIDQLAIQIRFKKESSVAPNFGVKFKPINPYIEVIEEAEGREVHSIKFWFKIDTNGHITNLHSTHSSSGNKYMEIESICIEFEFYLLKITTNYFNKSQSVISFEGPLKLLETQIQINDLSFPLTRNHYQC